jgi:hypothetical protein
MQPIPDLSLPNLLNQARPESRETSSIFVANRWVSDAVHAGRSYFVCGKLPCCIHGRSTKKIQNANCSDTSGFGTPLVPGPFLRAHLPYAKAAKVSLDGSRRCVAFA